MNRTITVYGQAEMSVSPDSTIVKLALNEKDDCYRTALEKLEQKSADITEGIIALGVSCEKIRTENFNTQKTEKFERSTNGNFVAVDNGYCCSQILSAEFGVDTVMLGDVLNFIGEKIEKPDMQILFDIKDKSRYEEELFRMVTEDAMRKAKAFCAPANARIGKLISVDCNNSVGNKWTFPAGYGHTTLLPPMQSEKRPYGVQQLAVEQQQSVNSFDNIIPQDKTITDNAVFVWEIIDEEL